MKKLCIYFMALIAMFISIASFAAVEVNKATNAELDGIKGIGPALSTTILNERQKGEFKDWNDFITRVKGMGEKKAPKLSEAGLVVNGAIYPSTPAKKEAKTEAKKQNN